MRKNQGMIDMGNKCSDLVKQKTFDELKRETLIQNKAQFSPQILQLCNRKVNNVHSSNSSLDYCCTTIPVWFESS